MEKSNEVTPVKTLLVPTGIHFSNNCDEKEHSIEKLLCNDETICQVY